MDVGVLYGFLWMAAFRDGFFATGTGGCTDRSR